MVARYNLGLYDLRVVRVQVSFSVFINLKIYGYLYLSSSGSSLQVGNCSQIANLMIYLRGSNPSWP